MQYSAPNYNSYWHCILLLNGAFLQFFLMSNLLARSLVTYRSIEQWGNKYNLHCAIYSTTAVYSAGHAYQSMFFSFCALAIVFVHCWADIDHAHLFSRKQKEKLMRRVARLAAKFMHSMLRAIYFECNNFKHANLVWMSCVLSFWVTCFRRQLWKNSFHMLVHV